MYFCILIRLQEYLVMHILMLCILMSLAGSNNITEVMNANEVTSLNDLIDTHELINILAFLRCCFYIAVEY